MPLQMLEQSWALQGACRNTDPVPFHATKQTPHAEVAAAKALCRGCPVKENCLADAMGRGERYGIWGGLNRYERKVLASSGRLTA